MKRGIRDGLDMAVTDVVAPPPASRRETAAAE
jgi:hypothetical protein